MTVPVLDGAAAVLDPVWEGNLRALAALHPTLAAEAERAGPAPDVEAQGGPYPTLRARAADGAWVQLSSRHDPRAEAERQVAGLGLERSRFVIVMGFGAGYHLEAALARAHPEACVCVVEGRESVLRAALRLRPLAAVLGDRRLRLFVGLDGERLFAHLQPSALDMAQAAPLLFQHPASMRCAPDYYEEAGAKIVEVIQTGAVEASTRVVAKSDFNLNWIENLEYTARHPGIIRLRDAFAGETAVVVSAGPSLNGSLDCLRALKGRAVILAVDTAMRTLVRAGVRPDLMVSVDFTPVNYKHFEGVDFAGIPAAFVATTYPACLRAHRGPKFIVDTGSPLAEWFSPCLGDGGHIRVGASTSHAAFSLAEYMGCRTAVLVGQDLAYVGDKTHADGVATQRRGSDESEPVRRVATNDGRDAATSLSLLTILRWLEEIIAASGMRVINTSTEGAFIRGTEVLAPAAAARLGSSRTFDAEARIARRAAAPRAARGEDLLDSMRDLEGRLLRAEFFARRAARRSRRLLDRYCSEPIDVAGVRAEIAGIGAAMGRLMEDWRLVDMLQPSLDGACIKMNWVSGNDGASRGGDFLRSVVDERRLIEDIRTASAQMRARLRREAQTLADGLGRGRVCAGASALLESTLADYFAGRTA